MKTILVTGPIGSGKSAVCRLLASRGVPVYDCDARTKSLYVRRKDLVPRLEAALGTELRCADGSLDKAQPKAGFWKCPYHNTRMCLQVLQIFS